MIRKYVLALVALAPSLAAAQVIFEPVRYQYQGERTSFYYGGSDPAVIARGLAVDSLRPPCSASADECSPHHPGLRVYSDAMPYWNAALFGFTPADARNQANASLPRYFRKRDLLALPAGFRGPVIVPAQAQSVRILPAAAKPEPKPALREPAPILIIPKHQPGPAAPRAKQAMFVAAAVP